MTFSYFSVVVHLIIFIFFCSILTSCLFTTLVIRSFFKLFSFAFGMFFSISMGLGFTLQIWRVHMPVFKKSILLVFLFFMCLLFACFSFFENGSLLLHMCVGVWTIFTFQCIILIYLKKFFYYFVLYSF